MKSFNTFHQTDKSEDSLTRRSLLYIPQDGQRRRNLFGNKSQIESGTSA